MQDGGAFHRTLPLSLSFDHRAVTGGEAARFLRAAMTDLALPT
jgi:pyruvate dehydrogenase E2 component (dihydrolipoamide acetyltransferase)